MQEGFADQVPVTLAFHGYELTVPSGHVMRQFHTPGSGIYQPYRERGLAQVSVALEQLHRTGAAIDIGANVGDTLAVIARHCGLDILCVEPSDFFSAYLQQNVDRYFADRASVVDWYVTAQDDEPGKALFHWGGTAKPTDEPRSDGGRVLSIGQLVDEVGDVALLKVDTDGADLAIVEGCLASRAPTFPIYFELEITTSDVDEARAACTRARQFFTRVVEAGYRHAFVWDDPGRFYGRVDLSAENTVPNLLNYLTQIQHRPIWGFDICLVHDSDAALYTQLSTVVSDGLLVRLGGV